MMTYTWGLYAREVKRFQKILIDTVFSPIVSIGLYLAVFGIVAGDNVIGNVSYTTFVYVGLLAMLVINSSFSNPGFALVIAKNVGTIIDLQLMPVKPWRIGIAYALAAVTRALITLAVGVLCTIWFIPFDGFHNVLFALMALLITGLQFGMIGVVVGVWAKNFETLTFITTFLMQPMIFLSGVFYPIEQLPHPWSFVALLNPIHHYINTFRYGVTGFADGNPLVSLGVMIVLSVLVFILMQYSTRKTIHV